MYYLTRSCRRANAVRQIYGCSEDIRILESIVRGSDNRDNLYEIWDGEGNLVKIAPKVFDYVQFKDGGWVHAPDMVQIKCVDIRESNSDANSIYVERSFPVDWKELGISRPLMKLEISDREYWRLDQSDVIPEFLREQVYMERTMMQEKDKTYDNILSPRIFYQQRQVADSHRYSRDAGRDRE